MILELNIYIIMPMMLGLKYVLFIGGSITPMSAFHEHRLDPVDTMSESSQTTPHEQLVRSAKLHKQGN